MSGHQVPRPIHAAGLAVVLPSSGGIGCTGRENRETHMVARAVAGLLGAAILALGLAPPATAQVFAPEVPTVPIPAEVDAFGLTLDQIRQYSSMRNFEVLGHSYFKIGQRTPYAKAMGRAGPEIGSGFNSVRVYDGIAYMAGYNYPASLFGILVADVHDPLDMKPLGFIPCHPGTHCTYLRVNRKSKVLVFDHDNDTNNPDQPPKGEASAVGYSFYDVSDPAKPRELSFVPSLPGGKTHGFDIDDSYVYGCGMFSPDMTREGLQIIDYSNPAAARQVATWHVTGMMKGEEYAPMDRYGPDGKPQIIQCHEVIAYNDRVYLAWRDAGMKVLDVKDRANPTLIGTYDYVPPFHGGFLGAAHTAAPVVTHPGEDPDLVVLTDEIFDCPNGFGRILDISDMKNPDVTSGRRPVNIQLLSTFRAPYVQDQMDRAKGGFHCARPGGPAGQISSTTHLPWFDQRSPSLLYVTWYNEGVRAMDISNPFAPKFVGAYLSPLFAGPGKEDRETREIFQDPDTNLLYATDGNGGGLTVLRYTGPIPKDPPIPGAR